MRSVAILMVALGAGSVSLCGDAYAQENDPQVSGTVEFKLQSNGGYASSYRPGRFTDTGLEVKTQFGVRASDTWSLQGELAFERVRQASRNGFVDGHGLFVEQLYVQRAAGPLELYAGKFNPRFAFAWSDERNVGLYSNYLAEDYELKEAIGAGASYTIETGSLGNHVVAIAGFLLDNTVLSTSVFTRPTVGGPLTDRPGRNRYRDGGPGNTQGPSSIALSLEGGGIPSLPGLTYTFGYRSLAAGRGRSDARTESALSVGASWGIELASDLILTPLVEAVWVRGADLATVDGNGDAAFGTRRYVTGALALKTGDWTFAAAHGTRSVRTSAEAVSIPMDRVTSVSVIYTLFDGLDLSVGWRTTREPLAYDPSGSQQRREVIGAQVAYKITF